MERGFFNLGNTPNMIVGTELTERWLKQTMPLTPDRNAIRIEWREVKFTVRIMTKLRQAVVAQAPVGYEDDNGFHYGTKTADSSLTV